MSDGIDVFYYIYVTLCCVCMYDWGLYLLYVRVVCIIELMYFGLYVSYLCMYVLLHCWDICYVYVFVCCCVML